MFVKEKIPCNAGYNQLVTYKRLKLTLIKIKKTSPPSQPVQAPTPLGLVAVVESKSLARGTALLGLTPSLHEDLSASHRGASCQDLIGGSGSRSGQRSFDSRREERRERLEKSIGQEKCSQRIKDS